MEDSLFQESCLKIQRSILMLLLKKHLKSSYQISSTTIALASLTSDNPGINKRDNALSKDEIDCVSLPTPVKVVPQNAKDLTTLIKIFQSLTFVDPVENPINKESPKEIKTS